MIATLLLSLALAAAPGVSCTTQYDRDFQLYRTRCSDGRSYTSTYDRDWDRLRTQETQPWKRVEPKAPTRR